MIVRVTVITSLHFQRVYEADTEEEAVRQAEHDALCDDDPNIYDQESAWEVLDSLDEPTPR